MFLWLSENIGTLITGAVITAIIAVIIIRIVKNKKNGKSSCGGGCQHCPMSGSCHNEE